MTDSDLVINLANEDATQRQQAFLSLMGNLERKQILLGYAYQKGAILPPSMSGQDLLWRAQEKVMAYLEQHNLSSRTAEPTDGPEFFLAFMKKVIRNLALDARRQSPPLAPLGAASLHGGIAESQLPDQQSAGFGALQQAEELNRLTAALRLALPVAEFSLLQQHVLMGKQFIEIAQEELPVSPPPTREELERKADTLRKRFDRIFPKLQKHAPDFANALTALHEKTIGAATFFNRI